MSRKRFTPRISGGRDMEGSRRTIPRYRRSGGWRQGWRRIRDWLLAAAIVALLANLVIGIDSSRKELEMSGYPVVTDGDSLKLDGERIRLKGIDAPELDQSCRRGGEVYPCGRESRSHLVALINGARVTCTEAGTDRYGRILALCEANGTELNRAMVESGWAIAYGDYVAEELRARSAGRGLWQGDFDRPQAWREGDHGVLEYGEGWLARIMDVIIGLASQLMSFVTGGKWNEAV